MSLNYEYVLQRAISSTNATSPRILDYGCGAKSPLLALGLARGVDIFGVDTPCHPETGRFRLLTAEGRIPFNDAEFDVVVSNQVFEHIAQPAPVFMEIARVLKPGGVFLALFPDNTVWFEGHLGLYFAHWLHGHPRLRYAYLVTCYALGFGYWRGTNGPRTWADTMTKQLKTEIFYHSPADLQQWCKEAFGSEPERLMQDWMIFRIEASPRLRWLLPLARQQWMEPFLSSICRLRAGLVLRNTKPAGGRARA